MSAEDVELIRSIHPGPDLDLVSLIRDDRAYESWRDALVHLFDPDVRCTMRLPGMAPVTYSGLDGLRDAWLDRLRHWDSYRDEIEDVVDGAERVAVVHRFCARPRSGGPEISHRSATVWTVRNGRIAGVDFNVPHAEALAALGITE